MNFENVEKIIIETDEKDPVILVTIDTESVIVEEGYRVRVIPKVTD